MTEFNICAACLTAHVIDGTVVYGSDSILCKSCAQELMELRIKSDDKVIKKFFAKKRREQFEIREKYDREEAIERQTNSKTC